ncbi:MAG: PAS domain-containing protein, partial [Deltaproteobacteria bacterium]|nr:PAS domain-containing protein [Deltaproteobacteria bacterium]
MKTEHKIMAVSVTFGLFFWIIDAALDYFLFYEGTLLSLLLTDVPAHEVYIRLVVMACFLAFGVLMSGVVGRRKRVEEMLRESEERLAMAVEASRAGVYGHNVPIGPELYHSERWADILGYELEELPRHDRFLEWLLDQIYPDDASRLEQAYSDFIEGRSPVYDVEIRMRHKSENWVHVRGLSKAAERDEDGRVTHIVGVMLDITEQMRAQDALQKRTHDLSERVKELNCLYGISHLVEKPGITLQDIMQGTVDLMPSAWQYPEIACARIILDAQEYRTGDWEGTMWKQASDIVVGGEPIGVVKVGYCEKRPERDEGPFLKEERNLINAIAERLGRVVERIRADDALRESRERFRALAKVAPVGIFRTDVKGHYLYVNERWCEIAGLTPQEARGQGWAQGIHPDDRERVFAEWYKSAQKELPFESEYRFRRPDGVTTWVFGQAMAEKSVSGEIAGYVGT